MVRGAGVMASGDGSSGCSRKSVDGYVL